VESPAKAKTIKKYLGRSFDVKASGGHGKDLPKSKIGVDVENGFQPDYDIIKGKAKILSEIKRAARKADRVLLATDPDREGEAIAWHIAEEIGAGPEDGKVRRVLFNEITKNAIQKAISEPQDLDTNRFDAQQARRILDRLVGYQISPILWRKVRRGLSAGRVQSVAVRLVVEREREIQAFRPEEYWTVDALLAAELPPEFRARLVKLGGQKAGLKDGEATRAVVDELARERFTVAAVERKERRRNPPPPFTTAKLQQEAANRLGFTAKKTMTLAQRLYEGVELGDGAVGLISYAHRTPSASRARPSRRSASSSAPGSEPTTSPSPPTSTAPSRRRRRRPTRPSAPPRWNGPRSGRPPSSTRWASATCSGSTSSSGTASSPARWCRRSTTRHWTSRLDTPRSARPARLKFPGCLAVAGPAAGGRGRPESGGRRRRTARRATRRSCRRSRRMGSG
jgi:5S rRNA maturation endonuclease (ribonuclease M5)